MIVTLIILLFLIIYLLYMRPTVSTKHTIYMTILLAAVCLFLLYKCITCYIEWNEYSKKLDKKIK